MRVYLLFLNLKEGKEKKLSFECWSIVIEGNYVVHPMDYTILLTNVGFTYGITLF